MHQDGTCTSARQSVCFRTSHFCLMSPDLILRKIKKTDFLNWLEAFNTQPVICVDPLNTKNAGDKLIGNSVVESPTSTDRESILRLEEMVETLLILGEQESTMLNTELTRENQDLKIILSQLQLAQSSIDIRMTTGSHSWTGDEAAESPSSPLLQSHRRYRTKSGLKIPGVDKDPNLE